MVPGRAVDSGCPTTGGEPRLAELAALLLGGGAPDAGLLVGGQGEVETGLLDLATAADPLGRLDLVHRGARGADGEEQIGLGAPAGSELPPVTFVPLDRAIPHEGHADSSTHQSVLPSL